MNMDRLNYRYWEHEVWNDPKTPLVPKYTNIVDGCDPTVAIGDFEFCTGLKDKNGNLIYEGDIVKDDSLLGRKYTVNWDCDNVQFEATANFYDTEFSEIYGLYVDSAKKLEIISNIHEQKD